MSLLDIVFPKACLGCGKLGAYICSSCIEKSAIPRPFCPYCRKPSIDGNTHVSCKKTLGIDGLTSVWKHQGIIRKAIISLKYRYATEITSELGVYLPQELKNKYFPSISTLTPIPTYWHKENVRGFNQSLEIGKVLAHKMEWEFLPDLLIKTKNTPPQAELKADKRKQNLRGTIAVFPIHKSEKLPESVILFDDVFTTGSTMFEACMALKRNGIKTVWGIVVAC